MDDRQKRFACAAAPTFEALEDRLLLDATTPIANLQAVGDFIVYQGYDGHDYEIYLYDHSGLTQLTDNNTDDINPHTDGQSIVWQGSDGNDDEIYHYRDGAITQLTDNNYDDEDPRVDGDSIVWLGPNQNNTDNDVYLFNISDDSITQLSTAGVNKQHVRICGSNVVWYAQRGNDKEIFLYDGNTTTQLTHNNGDDKSPQVSSTHVVWRGDDLPDNDDDDYNDYLHEDEEIFLYEIATGITTNITDDSGDDTNPCITEKSILWSGKSTSDDDREIYHYNISSGTITQLTHNDIDDFSIYPNADGGLWIDNSDHQVYRWSDADGGVQKLTEDGMMHTMPSLSGETLVWKEDTAIWLMDTTGDESLVQFTSIGQVPTPEVDIIDSAQYESDVSGGYREVIIRLSAPTDHPVTMNYATSDGPSGDYGAVDGSDYQGVTGSITFLPGDVARSISIPILGDYELEEDEYFTVTISSVSGAVLSTATASVTLLDDDTPVVTVSDAEVIEGDSGETKQLRFKVTISQPAVLAPVKFTYSVHDGVINTEDDVDDEDEALLLASSADGDYTAVSDIEITFEPGGYLTQYIYVDVAGDEDTEFHESLILEIYDIENATANNTTATGTILNDDVEVSFSESSLAYSKDEGDTGNTTFTFTVELSHPSAHEVSLSYATADHIGATNAATADDTVNKIVNDYLAATGELVFDPGVTSQSFTITIHGDDNIEEHETFAINLSDAVNATITTPEAIATIFDDDAPRVSVSDVTINEGAAVVNIYPLKDIEGDAGYKNYNFLLTLSQPQNEDVTVFYEILAGTCELDEDLDIESTTGSVTFTAGQIHQYITVKVVGDETDEVDERFKVQLISIDGPAELPETMSADGWILNDDKVYSRPTLVCYDYWDTEDSGGQIKTFLLPVTLSHEMATSVSVNYTLTNSSAKAGEDYMEIATGTLTFNPGDTEKTITVIILCDTEIEGNESFKLALSDQSAGTNIGRANSTIQIIDDDPAELYAEFTVTLDKYIAKEVEGDGEGGDTSAEDEYYDITVFYETTDNIQPDDEDEDEVFLATADTDGIFTAGEDYAFTSGSLTFSANDGDDELTQTIRVPIYGDITPEDTESFRLHLSSAVNAKVLREYAVATLTNDDTNISFEEDSLTVTKDEGNSGFTTFDFYLQMSHQIESEVEVYFSTADGTAISSSEDENVKIDFIGRTRSSTTFIVDERPKDDEDADDSADDDETEEPETTYYAHIKISVYGDSYIEEDETFTLTLIDARGGNITGQLTASATITDDDTPTVSVSDAEIIEGDSGQKKVKLTVSLSRANEDAPITIDYATTGGGEYVTTETDGVETTTFEPDENSATGGETNTNGVDYIAQSGTLTFAAGETTKTISIYVNGDTDIEQSETFLLLLENASGAVLANDYGQAATVTIKNDDTGITMAELVEVTEGTGLSTTLRMYVELNQATTEDVTVNWMTSDGTAKLLDGDYNPAGGMLTIPAGETQAEFTVEIIGDDRVESNEQFYILLYNSENATIETQQATIQINDDDVPRLSITDDVEILEGDSGTSALVFHVRRYGSLEGENITVRYTTIDGTAQAGSDYIYATQTLTFTPDGDNEQEVIIYVNGDTLSEAYETFTLELSDVSANAVITDGIAVGTIKNDDASVQIADASIEEDHEGSVTLEFTLTLEHPSAKAFSVNAQTADHTALAGEDYNSASETITFAAGATSATFSVTILSDYITEENEDFYVQLSGATGGTIARDTATGIILNDDADPLISILDAKQIEGNSGTTQMQLTLELSNPSQLPVTVYYQTADGAGTYAAYAASDYQAISPTQITFAAGETSKTIYVLVYGESYIEPDEYFEVQLSSAENADITKSTAVATIRNDDTIISIDDAEVTESDSGTVYLEFPVTLSASTSFDVTLNYSTTDGSAIANSDYYAVSSSDNSKLTIAAGETQGYIRIQIIGDLTAENTETLLLNLSQAVNASLETQQVTGTIKDNDPTPQISIEDLTISESDSGIKTATVTLTLSNPASWPVSASYQTADGTATIEDNDYQSSSGTVVFPAAQTLVTINLGIYGDSDIEPNEVFWLNLSNPEGATLADTQGSITITDDDTPADAVMISVDSPSVREGDSGGTLLTFNVSLSKAVSFDVGFDYNIIDGTAIAADGDYIGTGTIRFTIPAGQTSGQIFVTILGDGDIEENETLTLAMSNPSTGAILTASEAVGTIENDDSPIEVSITDASVTETNSGQTTMEFIVTLSMAPTSQVIVNYVTADGTATTANGDYTARNDSLTFTPGGATSQSIWITINGDSVYEADEIFTLQLISAIGASLGTSSATGTITNDDDAPQLSLADATVAETDSGEIYADLTFTLSGVSGSDTSVDWYTQDATATAGADYTAASGTATIAAGQLTTTITIAISDDQLYEPQEHLLIILDEASVVGATLVNTQAAVYINDNEPEPEPSADMAVSFDRIDMSTIAIPGQRASVRVAVTNVGELRALGEVQVSLYASLDGIFDESDILLGSTPSKRTVINSGRSRNYTIKFTVTGDMPDQQSYQLIAVVTSDAAIDDINAANDIAVDTTARTSPWRFGDVPGVGNTSLLVTDANGHSVTLSLTGGGWGQVSGKGDFDTINIHSSSDRSNFIVKASENIIAGSLVVDSSLKMINAANLSLTGDSEISGRVIKLADISGGATVSIANTSSAVNMSVDEITDASIESEVEISKLTLTRWLDTDAAVDVLSAPDINKLQVNGYRRDIAGDFIASVDVSGELKNAIIKGSASGDWLAGSIGNVNISGDMANSYLLLTDELTGRNQTLGKLKVGGAISNTTINSAGDINQIQATGLYTTDVLAGVSATGRRSETASDFATTATINNIKITGSGRSTDRFLVDSNFSAAVIKTANIINGDFAGSDISFNALDDASGNAIKLIKHIDKADKSLNWKYPPPGNNPFEGPDDIIRLL